MDKAKIENGYSFLPRDIKRMLKRMNYDMVRTVWTAIRTMLHANKRTQRKADAEQRHLFWAASVKILSSVDQSSDDIWRWLF